MSTKNSSKTETENNEEKYLETGVENKQVETNDHRKNTKMDRSDGSGERSALAVQTSKKAKEPQKKRKSEMKKEGSTERKKRKQQMTRQDEHSDSDEVPDDAIPEDTAGPSVSNNNHHSNAVPPEEYEPELAELPEYEGPPPASVSVDDQPQEWRPMYMEGHGSGNGYDLTEMPAAKKRLRRRVNYNETVLAEKEHKKNK